MLEIDKVTSEKAELSADSFSGCNPPHPPCSPDEGNCNPTCPECGPAKP